MKNMGKLLDAMNDALEVPNLISSNLKELNRFYDPATTEYVFTLEYRVKVAPNANPVKLCKVAPLIDSILDRRLA